jgi:hypothetical protein
MYDSCVIKWKSGMEISVFVVDKSLLWNGTTEKMPIHGRRGGGGRGGTFNNAARVGYSEEWTFFELSRQETRDVLNYEIQFLRGDNIVGLSAKETFSVNSLTLYAEIFYFSDAYLGLITQ